MTRPKRSASLDDLSKLVADLTEQVKVLVTVVDDLRCEIEWCARNHGDLPPASDATSFPQQCISRRSVSELSGPTARHPEWKGSEAAESAMERLAAMERELTQGEPAKWQVEWDEGDAPELPTARIIEVGPKLWNSMLDLRPAHVVSLGCCCEAGIGAPYLLAWRVEDVCFLRELTDEEALALQRTCLDATCAEPMCREESPSSQTQLGFWQE